PTDKLIRTLGLYRHAQATVAAMDAPERALAEAYAAGVNAYLETRRGRSTMRHRSRASRPMRPRSPRARCSTRCARFNRRWRRKVRRRGRCGSA
ncbi:MAG: penicillin acylase family protein, partial [Betaproteobacteria bacterium]